jgi:hypothetical protein
MNDTFNKIYLYTRNKSEPLYEYLQLSIPDTNFLEIHEGISHLNTIDIDTHFFGQTLIIFDDLMQEKNQEKINVIYLRGRKLGISVCYLCQKYSVVNTIIRENCNYLILKKINGKRDITSILRNASLSCEKEPLLRMYEFCVSGNDNILNFLLIDFAPEFTNLVLIE